MKPLDVIKEPRFLAQLKRHEGTKKNSRGGHIAYRCTAGALTIGYGHNLDSSPVQGLTEKSVLTDEAAEALLFSDVSACADDVTRRLPWIDTLDEARVGVMLNMCFNLGIGRLCSFRNFLRHAQQGSWEKARSEMLDSRWASQVGRRAVELATQMQTGLWQDGIKAGA